MRLIDADKLITETKRIYCEDCDDNSCDLCWVTDYIDYLTNAPTVEAEPIRHAKWLPIYYDNQPMICACSLCDRRVVNKYELPRYCPTCGAKMDEEADNE